MQDFLLLLLGAVIGFFGQLLWRQYERRVERRQQPEIVVTKLVRGNDVFAELHNVGTDNIMELEVSILWLQDGLEQSRVLKQFYRPDEDPAVDRPALIEYLPAGERVLAAGLPASTDEGVITITVNGLGVRSDKLFTHVSELAVGLKRLD